VEGVRRSELPEIVPATIRKHSTATSRPRRTGGGRQHEGEANHYQDGDDPARARLRAGGRRACVPPRCKLLACTRRGEVWLIDNPTAGQPGGREDDEIRTGLQPRRSASTSRRTTWCTRCSARNSPSSLTPTATAKATEYLTVCDKWACPATTRVRLRPGAKTDRRSFYITLTSGSAAGTRRRPRGAGGA